MTFASRRAAGRELANLLVSYRLEDPFVLALPRGGVPVGFEIAKRLKAPLDVIVAQKITTLKEQEFGIGAVAERSVELLDEKSVNFLGISPEELEELTAFAKTEVERRIVLYRKGRHELSIQERSVILVDDGIATGVTVKAAVMAVKTLLPKEIILAVPVCSHDAAMDLENEVDQFVTFVTPFEFKAVGSWYKDFLQVTDEEVLKLLEQAKRWEGSSTRQFATF